MSDNSMYWKKLVSIALRNLQDEGKADSVYVIRKSNLKVEYCCHDNWNGGIDYWNLFFCLGYKDYTAIENKKNDIQVEISNTLERFHTDDSDRIGNVFIRPIIEQYIDWNVITTITKKEIIQLIQEEKEMLIKVATGKIRFKDDGVEDNFQIRHKKITDITNKLSIEYPVQANSLAAWWDEVRIIPHYTERRDYINKLFSNILEIIQSSEEPEKKDALTEIMTTQEKVKTISHQAYERFESAKRQFENIEIDERARKDAIRSCFDAMEALIKELGCNDEIGNATKKLIETKDDQGVHLWGHVEIVKDGNNLFNLLHRLYPDIRHGTQDINTADMTIEEAEYFVGRVTTFMKYIAFRATKLGIM